MSKVIPDRVAQRALTRFVRDESGCNISTYSLGSHGYAQIGWSIAGQHFMTTAPRAAWVAAYGQIPDDLTIDHLCRVRPCVRLGHLRLLSREANSKDATDFKYRDLDPDVCAHGHDLTGDNLYRNSRGWRFCRECARERMRRKAA